MSISTRWRGDFALVTLAGGLDATEKRGMLDEVGLLLAAHPAVVVCDLAAVTSLDLDGAVPLEQLARRGTLADSDVYFVRPAMQVERVLDLLGLAGFVIAVGDLPRTVREVLEI